MSTSITGDFGELVIHTEMIDVSSALPKPDPGWRFTDGQGHEHYQQAGREPYPTLVEVVDDRYWCDDCADEHIDSHLECRLCGQEITPGTVFSLFREMAPGRTSYLLNGEPISEEQARRIYEQQR